MSAKFHELWIELTPEEKRRLAAKAKTSVAYLSHIANGQRRAGRKTIESLVEADERIGFDMFFRAANGSAIHPD